MKIRLLLPAALALLCCACVTHIRPDVTYNPPPTEPFSHFQHFLLAPVEVSPQAHETYASTQIQTYIQQRAGGTLAGWETRNRDSRVLVVKPYIEQLKFVGSGARFFAGAMAGSSAVLMRVKFIDAQTGHVIADPEFYQRAAASGGNWSIGGTDHGCWRALPPSCSNTSTETMRKRLAARPEWTARNSHSRVTAATYAAVVHTPRYLPLNGA